MTYPDNGFERWASRFPEDTDPDPREMMPCQECGRTFAWRGYGGLCGWCQFNRDFGRSGDVVATEPE